MFNTPVLLWVQRRGVLVLDLMPIRYSFLAKSALSGGSSQLVHGGCQLVNPAASGFRTTSATFFGRAGQFAKWLRISRPSVAPSF